MYGQLVINGVIAGGTYALVGVGFGLILYTGRFFHVAHGGIILIAPYVAYALAHLALWPPYVAGAIGVVAAAAAGALVELVLYRPLRDRSTSPTGLFIASLGVLIILQNALGLGFGNDVITVRTEPSILAISIAGGRITIIQLGIILSSLGLAALTWTLLRLTNLGKMLRAVGDDRDLAEIRGISAPLISMVAVVLGSGLGGVAALLVGHDVGAVPSTSFQLLFMGFIVAIGGGMNSIGGMVLIAFSLGVAREMVGWLFPTQWQDAFVYFILAGLLVLRPQGILGTRKGMRSWL